MEVTVHLCPECTRKYDAYNEATKALGENLSPALVEDLCGSCMEHFLDAAREAAEAVEE